MGEKQLVFLFSRVTIAGTDPSIPLRTSPGVDSPGIKSFAIGRGFGEWRIGINNEDIGRVMHKKRSLSCGVERLGDRILLAADGWSTEVLPPVDDTIGLESAEYLTSPSEAFNTWKSIHGSQFEAFGQTIALGYNGFNASLDFRSLGEDWADAEVMGAQSSLGSTLRLLTTDGDVKNERIFYRSPEGVTGLDHVSVVARATDGRLLVASVQVTVKSDIVGELSTDSSEFNGSIATMIGFSDSTGQNTPDSFSLAVAYDPSIVRLSGVDIGSSYETLAEHRIVPHLPGSTLAAVEINANSLDGDSDGKFAELRWERVGEGDPAIRIEPSISWRLQDNGSEITPQVVKTETRFRQSVDVDGNGTVTAVDALRVINSLASDRSDASAESGIVNHPEHLSLINDVNGDGRVSALDALVIINTLNHDAPSQASASYSLTAGDVDRLFSSRSEHRGDQEFAQLF